MFVPRCRSSGTIERSQLFDRAETDSVSLPQRPVNGTRFGDAHLSPVDQGRDIRGVRIAVTHEPLRRPRLINGRAKDPEGRIWVTKLVHQTCLDACTTVSSCKSHEATVSDIPFSVKDAATTE